VEVELKVMFLGNIHLRPGEGSGKFGFGFSQKNVKFNANEDKFVFPKVNERDKKMILLFCPQVK
jgi:hypothetical protein